MNEKRAQKRADAQQNRARILEAARTRFAEDGLEAQVDAIAREAGVAVGTIYHHFGTKEGLLDAVIVDRFQHVFEYTQTLLEEPDSWTGLERFLRYLAERQFADRAFKELVANHQALREHIAGVMSTMMPVVQQLVERAQTSGQLRVDVVAEDLPALLAVLPGNEVDATVRQRYLAIILDGLRVHHPQP